ncbi:hypothetical protein [Chromobacterium sinusclupearum]|uniref:hypothetical protein n=1 Tax=Chromobacterium sinusclupearum TaxID=2077146 RepID=UPI0011AF43C1|nr:hypothetical protein [Chromobacterium sinusclupearum]
MLRSLGRMTTGDSLLNNNTQGSRVNTTANDGPPPEDYTKIDPNAGTPAAIVTLSNKDGSVLEKAIVYEKPKSQASGKAPPTGFEPYDPKVPSDFYVKDAGKFANCAWDVASLFILPEYKVGKAAVQIAKDVLLYTKSVDDTISDCKDGIGVIITHKQPPKQPPPKPATVGGGGCEGVDAAHLNNVNNAVVGGMGSLGSSSGYVECSEPTIYDGSTGGGGGGGGGGPNDNHFVIEMD